ncbi:MAG: acyltransferase [Sphingomonadales bacterium]|nr:MAG: acyltransferase [Sphingomonadales bacterium]
MSTKERLDSVQILRFIAATSVVLLHLSAPLNQKFDSPLLDFPNGRAGVDIFFVISGFIIAYTAAGTRDAVEFMKRRLFRVVPI